MELRDIDKQILITIHECTKNALFDIIMPIFTYLGHLGIIWIIIGLALMLSKKYRFTGIMTLFSILLCAIFGDIVLKNIFHRVRPFMDMNGIGLLIQAPSSYSFPSGHTTVSFSAASIIAKRLTNYSPSIFLLAIIISFSRLYLLVHFPLDILGGALLGLICAKITLTLFPKIAIKTGRGEFQIVESIRSFTRSYIKS